MSTIIGKLRHRVTIQTFTTVEDSFGGTYQTWLPLTDSDHEDFSQSDYDNATVWGSVGPIRGREFWDAKQSNSEVEGKAVIRYRDDVTPNNRLWFKGRPLKILSVLNPAERKEYLEVYYKEWQ